MRVRNAWQQSLLELRWGIDRDHNLKVLAEIVAATPSDRRNVQISLARARGDQDEERANGAFCEAAYRLCSLKKRRLAHVIYNHAARKNFDKAAEELIEIVLASQSSSETEIAQLRIDAAEKLLEGRPSREIFAKRIQFCLSWLLNDANFLEECLSLARAREYFDGMVELLSLCIEKMEPSNASDLRLKLGHVYRFGLGSVEEALSCFEAILQTDPNNREGWGELLECLNHMGAHRRLSDALSRRITLTSGLEREQLTRQRDTINASLGEEV